LLQALEVARSNNSISQQIRAIFQISRVYYRKDNLKEAQSLEQEAIDLAEANRMGLLVIRGLFDISLDYRLRNQPDKARQLLTEAARYARMFKLSRSRMMLIENMANLDSNRRYKPVPSPTRR
jgi:tetratricopeptide (TPR) repeat protein